MPRRTLTWALPLVAIAGVVAAALAAATVWLLVTDPVAVSTATSTGNVGFFVRAIGWVFVDAITRMAGYL